jgi:hypothetical protein
MLERIDYVVRPEMRDQTAMDELPQDARSDFDQQYRRAVALEAGNDPSECEDAGCINARHGITSLALNQRTPHVGQE